jgi:hypothetical protein
MVLYPRAGSAEVDLGPVHPQDCEVCQCEQPFRLRLTYRYEHLFWVLGNVRGRSYLLVCEVCRTAYRVPPAVGRKLARLDRDPIPFLRRFGCLLLFLAVLVLGIIGWLVELSSPK